MRTLLGVGFVTALVLCGCSRSGDFSAFIVSEVAKYGGRSVTNTPPPTVEARWTIESDTNGFQVMVTGAPFASIDAAMHHAFGTPQVSVSTNLTGQPHRVWGAVDVGVAIQLIGHSNGAEVICVRGVRNLGELF